MNTVEKLTLSLGRTQVLREVQSGDRLLAAVGRGRHQGGCVDLSYTGSVQLVFNVQGGQLVELRCGDRSVRGVIRAASIGIVVSGNSTCVAVTGKADTFHIIVSKEQIKAVAGGPASLMPSQFAVCAQCRQHRGNTFGTRPGRPTPSSTTARPC